MAFAAFICSHSKPAKAALKCRKFTDDYYFPQQTW